MVFLRWRQAGPATRQHVGWLLAAVAFLVVTVVTQNRLPYPWSDVSLALGFTAVIAAVAAAAAAERSAAQLQRSREQLVVAREAERRRLHRDLHDGLGPELAGMALLLHAIGGEVDNPELRARLSKTEATMRKTVAEVRRIVEDLRPPALDELGLVGAIQERAYALATAAGLVITVDALGELGNMPPAVEIVAFRIAVEALVNTVRHADATRCMVRLTPEGAELHVEVSDDGRGTVAPRPGGVGLGSMRARGRDRRQAEPGFEPARRGQRGGLVAAGGSMTSVVTVLVVDDHPTFRAGVRAVLEAEPGITVLGEATDGEAAIDRARDLAPDVVLMDLLMPGMGGVEATRRLASAGTRVVVLTMSEGDQAVFARCVPVRWATCSRTPRQRPSSPPCERRPLATPCWAAASRIASARSSRPPQRRRHARSPSSENPDEIRAHASGHRDTASAIVAT